MAVETPREKLVYLGLVPIMGAVAGALATSYLAKSSCPVVPADLVAILKTSGLSGPDKVKAMEIYQDISDRPWSLARSFMSLFFISLGLFSWAIIDRIRGTSRK